MKIFLLIGLQCFLLLINNGHGFVRNSFEDKCVFNVNDLGQPSPLLIEPGTVNTIRAIDTKGTLAFSAGQSILFACPGANNYIKIKGTNVTEVIGKCIEGQSFSLNNTKFNIYQIECQQWPESKNRENGLCTGGNTLIETGFQISTGFMATHYACHNTTEHNTLYTKFILGRDANGAQSGVKRPTWRQGSFFSGLNVENLYKRATQRITFAVLLSSTSLAAQYIHLTNDYFLSKGHLVAKADYLYGAHQMTTFWYSNAAPQWQTFNGNNWNSLENDIRKFAAQIGEDLEVYTGTYGHASLPDVNGNDVDLHLTVIEKMPAPKMFWKIIYNSFTEEGTAFIGLNNPYELILLEDDIRCTDICHQIKWLTWKQYDIKRGYSYCCEVNEFRSRFPNIPYFPVSSILK